MCNITLKSQQIAISKIHHIQHQQPFFISITNFHFTRNIIRKYQSNSTIAKSIISEISASPELLSIIFVILNLIIGNRFK